MERIRRESLNNPREGANPLSIVSFTWLLPTYLKGFRRDLELSDLYSALRQHRSNFLGNRVSEIWNKEEEKCFKLNKKSKPKLYKVLAQMFWADCLILGFLLAVVELIIRLCMPFALANLLDDFKSNDEYSKQDAFYWCLTLVAAAYFDCFISHNVIQGLFHVGLKLRLCCCTLIYRKVLRVSRSAFEDESSVGRIVNLVTNDVSHFETSLYAINYVWIGLVQAVIISYLMYKELGVAAVGGIAVIVIFLPIYGILGKRINHLTKLCVYRTDERLRLINEILSGLKVIKMYVWEKAFVNLVEKARRKELKKIKEELITSELTSSFECYIPRFCLFVTILAYLQLGNNLDASKVYLITLYYTLLRSSIFVFFPLGVKNIAKLNVSLKRIEDFLTMSEYECLPILPMNTENTGDHLQNVPHNAAVSFKNYSAKWSRNADAQSLSSIDLSINKGSLVAIVGQVGSGKSSFIQSILNEIPYKTGQLHLRGKLSYCSQEPWIFGSTIRQNILFGKPFNEERYRKVCEVCQLEKDFELLSNGDQTLAGEKGTTLSGGQCARINLARAVYYDADIYLLDDPLSAVDASVGKAIFDQCIRGYLGTKTVILTTHQVQFLCQADEIIVLKNGRIEAGGSFEHLRHLNIDLMSSVNSEDKALHHGSDVITGDLIDAGTQSTKPKNIASGNDSDDEDEEIEEGKVAGSIKFDTYKTYFLSSGHYFLIFLVFIISIMFEMSCGGTDYFIAHWTAEEQNYVASFNKTHEPLPPTNDNNNNSISSSYSHKMNSPVDRELYFSIYTGFIIFTTITTTIQAWVFFLLTVKISKSIHIEMFRGTIRTSMSFFNTNPLGRIMNRFSKDMNVIDSLFPRTLNDVKQGVLAVITVFFLITNASIWFLIPICILLIVIWLWRTFYIKTSRSLKRLEGIARSPVLKHLTDSVHGLLTIRALNADKVVIEEFDSHQDLHSSAWFLFTSGSRAFGLYTEFVFATLSSVITIVVYVMKNEIEASYAGLAISQALFITTWMSYLLRRTTDMENEITSVERVKEYCELPEEPGLMNDMVLDENWPSEGVIEFKNISLTYECQSTPALRNLSFTIHAKEKIGIVGRTGAGKSSIINVLFCLAEFSGEVYIDNIPISKVNVEDLRSKISIIPQQPVLFAGTLRKNLDPFEEYSDKDLWQALEEVELKSEIKSELGLDMRVMGGGANFSVGQRQLLCIARAIIRNSKIILLDEATANVDPHTDKLIQRTIRKKFHHATVLIIAHRLITVMDCSKILLMDSGQVQEFDHPYVLLQKESGFLKNMVRKTGPLMTETLMKIAKDSFAKTETNPSTTTKL